LTWLQQLEQFFLDKNTEKNGDWNIFGKYTGTANNNLKNTAPLANMNFSKFFTQHILTQITKAKQFKPFKEKEGVCTLHDRQQGYLQLNQLRDLLRKLDTLINTPSDDTLEESRYLIKLDYSTLHSASFERQLYWVLAMKAAHRAGRRTSASSMQKRQHKLSASTHNHQCKPCYDFTHDDKQMRGKLGLQAPNCLRPHPDANGIGNPSDKCLRKPDLHKPGTCMKPVYDKVAFSTCFRSATGETTICCPRRPCYTFR
jgi:hypothetical protein